MTVSTNPASFGKNTETLRTIASRHLLDANDVSTICCVPPATARAWFTGEKPIPARQISVLSHYIGRTR